MAVTAAPGSRPAASRQRPSRRALAQRNGALKVEPIRDGPLHVSGNLEVITGTGKTVNRVAECWLCRCGQSGKKPYCDGTHKRVGFRSGT